MTDLPNHDMKVMLDKKMIFIIHQRYKGGNRDYSSHFSVTFETISKLLIAFIKLIWEKSKLTDLLGHDGKLT